MATCNALSLRSVVGGHYDSFWRFRGRYRVCKGSRASKKSKTAALWFIVNMMSHPGANTLVVRKVFRTVKDSCFTELKWAINRLGVNAFWRITESPLEMTYIPTGQKIYFRGLDDPIKITSITVERGALCWGWLEESYEVMKEDDFNMLDESIRGEQPRGLWKTWTLTFNPWNERHWIKARFFDVDDPDNVLAMTTNYTMNEWLDDADRELFNDMRVRNPRRYQVAGLGAWGIVEGVIYENCEEAAFDPDVIRLQPGIRSAFGLDFGYSTDPSALFCGLVDVAGKVIYVFDELYERGLTNNALYNAVAAKGYAKEQITADSSEPKSIEELRILGLSRIRGARKGKDSVAHGIQYLQNYKIFIHPQCVNFQREIANYSWKVDRSGARLNVPVDDENHLMDALRYALEDMATPGFELTYLL